MSYAAGLPKNLSHLMIGGLPEWSARPELSKRKHLADLLAMAGFATAIIICYSQMIEETVLGSMSLPACTTLTMTFFAGYLFVRLRPHELGGKKAQGRGLSEKRLESTPEPLLRLRNGLAPSNTQGSPLPAGGSSASTKVALIRWTYYRSGSCLN